jgi:hypothetical protein
MNRDGEWREQKEGRMLQDNGHLTSRTERKYSEAGIRDGTVNRRVSEALHTNPLPKCALLLRPILPTIGGNGVGGLTLGIRS